MQDAVSTEACDGAECRAAVHTDRPSMLQQPLIQEAVVMLGVFVDVEAQVGAVHIRSFPEDGPNEQYPRASHEQRAAEVSRGRSDSPCVLGPQKERHGLGGKR